MICPACGAEQPDPPGRFCAACALALPVARPKPDVAEAPKEMRCPQCAVVVRTSRCHACGAKVHWPDGDAPGDERPRKPVPRSD